MKVKQITKLKEIKYKHSGVLSYVCRAVMEPAPKRPYIDVMFVTLTEDGTVQTVGFPLASKVDLEKIKRQTVFTDESFAPATVQMLLKGLLDDCNIVEDGPAWLNIYNL